MIHILCIVVAVLALFIVIFRWHAKHSFYTVTGRFIGESSCGFDSGLYYRVDIFVTYFPKRIWVSTVDGKARCPYSSKESLLANWELPIRFDKEA